MYAKDDLIGSLVELGIDYALIERITMTLDDGQTQLLSPVIPKGSAAAMSRTPGGLDMTSETNVARQAAQQALNDLVSGLINYSAAITGLEREARGIDERSHADMSALLSGTVCTTAPALTPSPTCSVEPNGGS